MARKKVNNPIYVAREVLKKFLVTPLYLISLTRRELDMRIEDSMIIHLLVLLPL